ncbi:hypothetical protein JCM11251_005448 [Rhodosporidiobolus azoricus]
MSSAGKSDAPVKGKKRAERTITCSYCDMSFKKLEHLQRHERTHTLDRPYACDSCGKTFARQDTLHRHARLHLRKDEEGPNPKAGKKRRPSNASSPPHQPSSDGSPSTSSGSSLGNIAVPQSLPVPNSQASPSFSALGLSMDLPVAPPSFPAYTQPELRSIDPSVVSFPRRLSDAGHGAAFASAFCRPDVTSGATAFASQIAGTGTGGAGPPAQRPALLGSRPRALTLAGLPESLGCFSLVNSPEPTDGGESDASSDDENEESGGTQGTSPTGDGDADAEAWVDPFPPPESHYPSPAFSAYSPSALHTDTLTDLQAILANDPVPAAFHRPSPPPPADPDFDFEAFAASIEGPSPSKQGEAPTVIPSTLEELLNSTAPDLLHQNQNTDAQRYPTPPSGTLTRASLSGASEPSPALPAFEINEATVTAAAASFDLQAHLTSLSSAADAEQQAREAAATAALFGGFGMSAASPGSTVPATASSALGLNFGLPTPTPSFFPPVSKYHPPPPPQRGLSLPISPSAAAAVPQPAIMPAPPVTSASSGPSPSVAQAPFASLGATYTTTYPSLSLPVAGFDLPSSSSATSIAPLHAPLPASTNMSTSSKPSAPSVGSSVTAAAMNGQDIIAALASAWENRSRSSFSAPSSGGGSAALANLTFPSGSLAMPPLKSPFAHPAKGSTPAFYIPSSSTPTATTTASSDLSTSGGHKLNLPLSSWLA